MPTRVPNRSSLRLFKGQNYRKLKAKCLSVGELFLDTEFPADASSLGFEKAVEWKRPTELVASPQFVKSMSRFSVKQGELGNCWFLSALSAITQNPGLLYRVVPGDQDFADNYAGIFHFRFWQGGQWVDVVIDDRLPVVCGAILCFTSSRDDDEFWSALLEKAYAKLHGSYGALDTGKSFEATEDLTGGVTERFLLRREDLLTPTPTNLFSVVAKARQRGSLVTCSISETRETPMEDGLVKGHAYSVTGARRFRVNAPRRPYVELLRLRNPWGDETEWRGMWSDGCEEWNLIPKSERDKLQLSIEADGEFWISFSDFAENFDELSITSLNPTTVNEEAKEHLITMADVVTEAVLHSEVIKAAEVNAVKVWEVVAFDGAWVRNATAGGGNTRDRVFCSNPQYILELTEADDSAEEEGTCAAIVTLMQKNRRANQLPIHPIGFFIYKLGEGEKIPNPLTVSWLRLNVPYFYTRTFSKTRTVTHRLTLSPGRYLVIPCTPTPDQEAEFLLRVFCEKLAKMEEYDEEAQILDIAEESEDEVDHAIEDHLRVVFRESAGDANEVEAVKLQCMLDQLFPSAGFADSLDFTRSLLAMIDVDFSGTVSFYEFEALVSSLRRWVRVYNERKDEENDLLSGHSWGLGDALRDLGLQIPRRIRALVVVRYGDLQGHIALRDFLMATCRISVMLVRFEAHRVENDQHAKIPLTDWLANTLYC
ncbi:calpain-B-like [Penaeus chinensis]|uniref:calpain-B-like n=1 Tax=Penaeus chinensis TaxID=139456 RepID=UPI001FB59317|nr:calpain-B-like [Penaeus chinensis]